MHQVADVSTIEALFEPRSVAVIGASDDAMRIGGRPLRYLKEAGFAGAIYPVNPNRSAVQGLPAFASIGAVPGPIDLAIVALPAAAVVTAIEECAAKGVRAAVIFSSGFAETGVEGRELQNQLGRIAESSGMRILGPNCLGAFNSATGMYATFTASLLNGVSSPGPLAIASQSGAVGGHLAYLCAQRGVGVKYWITTGNEADIDLAESLLWLAQSTDVKVIIGYAEAIRDGATFIRALKTARRNRIAIVMLKVGRSQAGARAAASHTGALAGEDSVYDAVFRQYGVWRAESIEEMLDIAYACVGGVYPTSRRVGLVTASGGVGVQMADAAERLGMDVSPMPAETQAAIRAIIPFVSPANPIDVTAQVMNDLSLFRRFVELTLSDGGYDSIIIFLSTGPAAPSVRKALLGIFADLPARYPDKVLVLSMAAPIEAVREFEQAGFLVFEDTDRALRAMSALAVFAEGFAREQPASDIEPPPLPDNLPAILQEHSAKQVLADAGIPYWPESVAGTPAQVGIAAKDYAGPVVLKILSQDILHKTEVGGVVLNVAPDDAEGAATEMLGRVQALKPNADIAGILVSPMRTGGIETICGTFRDPVFGPVVMFGLGGVLVEVLKDVAFRVAPFDATEARRMIDEIRSRSVLDGVRGKPGADIDALATILVRLSEFAYSRRDHIAEIDINPLSAGLDGAVALDALITRG
jgi:acyl-CoA synthetase (NDP forming)